MAYWLKLISTKAEPIPNDWMPEHLRGELIQFESASRGDECPIQRGDKVLLAGSGWSRLVAAMTVESEPVFSDTPRWGPRWPWVLFGRPVVSIARAEDAPRLVDAGVPRSYGAGCLAITKEDYDAGVRALQSIVRME